MACLENKVRYKKQSDNFNEMQIFHSILERNDLTLRYMYTTTS